ncbi:hypothetical protein MNBD_GAMMA15-1200 [hydrothermal vent metagenome]|uniref:AbiEi antitoxin C-terminal domain-containing protein n=1 Tax=hydrothermal vent metagenome TaxID=652676 RepID=A0A3B0YFB1_9ZZZZ
MSIAQTIQNTVEAMPAGQIFGYQELPGYAKSPDAVIKAIGRLVSDRRLERFSKGKFYVPKKGVFGIRKPSDSELIRSMLYKDGRLRGYVTGLSLYNQLGLTTQVPRTITVSYNGGRQEKEFGTIRIKTVVTRIPVQEKDVKLLQYLDALKDIKKITDSDINLSLEIMCKYISELSDREQARLLKLAQNYYSPQVRALLGLLFSSLKLSVPRSLVRSLNPITIYKLKLDQSKWPMAREWNIR